MPVSYTHLDVYKRQMLKGSNKSGAAQTVDDSALYQQDTEVKCSDGSLVYDREFRG